MYETKVQRVSSRAYLKNIKYAEQSYGVLLGRRLVGQKTVQGLPFGMKHIIKTALDFRTGQICAMCLAIPSAL